MSRFSILPDSQRGHPFIKTMLRDYHSRSDSVAEQSYLSFLSDSAESSTTASCSNLHGKTRASPYHQQFTAHATKFEPSADVPSISPCSYKPLQAWNYLPQLLSDKNAVQPEKLYSSSTFNQISKPPSTVFNPGKSNHNTGARESIQKGCGGLSPTAKESSGHGSPIASVTPAWTPITTATAMTPSSILPEILFQREFGPTCPDFSQNISTHTEAAVNPSTCTALLDWQLEALRDDAKRITSSACLQNNVQPSFNQHFDKDSVHIGQCTDLFTDSFPPECSACVSETGVDVNIEMPNVDERTFSDPNFNSLRSSNYPPLPNDWSCLFPDSDELHANDGILGTSCDPYVSGLGLGADDTTFVIAGTSLRSHSTQESFPTSDIHESAGPAASSNNVWPVQRDPARDRLLLRCREKKMSYREIKQQHGFTEAESTLRGRWRSLTKPKDARVRKPDWQARDVMWMCHFARQLAMEVGVPPCSFRYVNGLPLLVSDQGLKRVPWKQVVSHMQKFGKTYMYGNATVKKKYIEICKEKLRQ